MPNPSTQSPPTRWQLYLCMAMVAGALLGWEVLLTRLASLRYHFHFGHLAVSNGLLGIGAAASWLGLNRKHWQPNVDSWLSCSIVAFGVSLFASSLALYGLPVHRGSMNLTGVLSFATFAIAGLLPFITGGVSLGLLLSGWPKQTARLYGVDLLAAGSACLLVPWLLPSVGMAGALAVLTCSVCIAIITIRPGWWKASATAALMALVIGLVAPLAPSKIDRPVLHSTWTPISRVDVVEVPPNRKTIRARGTPAPASSIPPQVEIMQDGSASTLLSDFSGHPESQSLLQGALYSAATQIRPNGDVFIIGFGGGDDIWSTMAGNPNRIDAIDLHAPVLDAHTAIKPLWSKTLLEDPRINMSVQEGRAALNQLERQYDIVQLTGIDTWAAMTSGAFMLAENFLYTTESFGSMMDGLRPNGVLQITRMAAEMETLRVLVQLRAALTERSSTPFRSAVFVVGSEDHQVATVLKVEGFTPAEVDQLTQWAENAGLIIHHAPGSDRDGLIQQFINTDFPEAFVSSFPRLIEATTDESPYFFQFTRWTRPTTAATAIREPTYISQGNPLWIVGLGTYALVLAFGVLFGPILMGRRAPPAPGLTRYFAGLGMGYIMVELALMNKLTLLVGHPIRAFGVTLAGMLVASGFASLQAHRFKTMRWIPLALAGTVVLVNGSLDSLINFVAHWSVAARCTMALAITAPMGLMLGLPFAHRIDGIAEEEIPWAWATNALFSVIGAILVIAISMTVSFSAVLWVAVGIYAVALMPPQRD